MGDLTENFDRSEFACKHCNRVDLLDRSLVTVLQRARTQKGKSLRIVSGYRCCAHNKRVGGAQFSQHLFGRAADVPGGYATATEWHKFGAIGVGVRGGKVVHVDVTPGRGSFLFDD
jgi:uncharacterized protein YcbK (DUF882 family)